jgi:hypothetical protein
LLLGKGAIQDTEGSTREKTEVDQRENMERKTE